jgi:hypothetical protein
MNTPASRASTQIPDNSAADGLRLELAALIEKIDELQLRVAPLLTARYQAVLGQLALKLLTLQLAVQSARYRAESLQARINRGEALNEEDLTEIDQAIELRLAEWRQQLCEQEKTLLEAQSFLANITFADAGEARRVKTAYRLLARYLHPDASPENQDLFEKYWANVQDAYENIDAVLIEALLHLVEHAVNARSGVAALAEPAVEVERLRALVLGHAERLAHITSQAPHCYANLLADEVWVAARQGELEVLITAESARLAQIVIRHAEQLAQLGIDQAPSTGDI